MEIIWNILFLLAGIILGLTVFAIIANKSPLGDLYISPNGENGEQSELALQLNNGDLFVADNKLKYAVFRVHRIPPRAAK